MGTWFHDASEYAMMVGSKRVYERPMSFAETRYARMFRPASKAASDGSCMNWQRYET